MKFFSSRPRSSFVCSGAASECCSLWVLLNNRNFPFSLPKKNIPERKIRFLICGEHPPEVARLCWIQLPVHQDVRRRLSGGLHAAPQRDLGDSLVFAGEYADQRCCLVTKWRSEQAVEWELSAVHGESAQLMASAPPVMAHTGPRLLGLRLRQLLDLVAGTRDPSDGVEDTLSIGERLPV